MLDLSFTKAGQAGSVQCWSWDPPSHQRMPESKPCIHQLNPSPGSTPEAGRSVANRGQEDRIHFFPGNENTCIGIVDLGYFQHSSASKFADLGYFQHSSASKWADLGYFQHSSASKFADLGVFEIRNFFVFLFRMVEKQNGVYIQLASTVFNIIKCSHM